MKNIYCLILGHDIKKKMYTEERHYMYMYRPFKLMVGVTHDDFIPKKGSCDWYYLTRFQTFTYLFNGKLPHQKHGKCLRCNETI